jgi:N-hydroxyarylamine O-acetyltransferase
MNVTAYLDRIAYTGPTTVDRETLYGIHRAHMLAIPYENLEIQLGRENLLSEAAFHHKLVEARRGGWCYEMNGLLTSVLREMGFAVRRVGGGVARELVGDAVIGNHMVGLVDLDRCYVTDVGLSDGPLDPFPLQESEWREGVLTFRLERLDEQWWRCHNHQFGLAPSFDFTEEARALPWYSDMSTSLQTDPTSIFKQLALACRRNVRGVEALRDTTYIEVIDDERSERKIESCDEYRSILRRILGQDLGEEAELLWEKVDARARERALQTA